MTRKQRRSRKKMVAVTAAPPQTPPMSVDETVQVRPSVRLWRAAGAAVQGVSHQRLGLPCQDAQGFRVLDEETVPGGALLIALADGAGSASYSDQGAQCAVDESLASLECSLKQGLPQTAEDWERVLRNAFNTARLAVYRLADSAGEWSREYASTLTCVIVSGERLIVGQIGDGAVVAVDDMGELFTATRLQRGEYANETHFLVQADALEQAEIEVIERPVNALAVMSDGLIRLALKMPSQEPHTPFFQPLFGFINTVDDSEAAAGQLAAFLNSERVNARTDDDKSFVLAARVTPLKRETMEIGQTEEVSPEETQALDQEGQ